MRQSLLLLFAGVVMMAGCAIHKDDARLQGTWLLNRAEAAAVSSNPPPRVAWVTYSHGRGRIIQPLHSGFATWQFCTALGELRAAVGLRIGILAVMHGLSVDGELEKILPPKPAAGDA